MSQKVCLGHANLLCIARPSQLGTVRAMLIFSVSGGHHGSELSESSTAGILRYLVMKTFKR